MSALQVFPFLCFRSVLDFDFEKLCSVSLSHLNVYACMVCGKYFQGKLENTPIAGRVGKVCLTKKPKRKANDCFLRTRM